ncbi:MAG: hypothetical protein HY695_01380 [Deltaproteobacteria bacterium]|nr:hypothetical protein [Deltaproteobacteria bacterium]
MKEATLVQKNLELSFEFTRYLLAHPEMEEKIPRGAQVALLPDYDKRLARFNLKNSERQREEGQPVVYVRIRKLNPDRPSRLVGTKIERVA